MKNLFKRKAQNQTTKASIPKVDFAQFAGSNELNLRLLESSFDDGNVSLFELFIISALIRLKNPRTIFEIGTFNGRTTLNLAANSGRATEIFTLDLPAKDLPNTGFLLAEMEKKYVNKPASGAKFLKYPEAGKITQLYGDSATFDFSKYENAIDFVFVDASHAYEYVVSDSKAALKMLRHGKGVVLWHDYDRAEWWPGVVQALDELYRSSAEFSRMVHFTGTSLVCLIKN